MTTIVKPPKIGRIYSIMDGEYKGRLGKLLVIHGRMEACPKLTVRLCDAWGQPVLEEVVIKFKYLRY